MPNSSPAPLDKVADPAPAPSSPPADPFERQHSFFSPSARGIVFAPPSFLADAIFLFLFLVAGLLGVWLWFAEVDVRVSLSGELVSLSPDVAVTLPQAGQLTAWSAHNGATVQPQETLGSLSFLGTHGPETAFLKAPLAGVLRLPQKPILGQLLDKGTLLATVSPSAGVKWGVQLTLDSDVLPDLRPGTTVLLNGTVPVGGGQAPERVSWVVPEGGLNPLKDGEKTVVILPLDQDKTRHFLSLQSLPGELISAEIIKGRERLWHRVFRLHD